jgi:hypothetical protein
MARTGISVFRFPSLIFVASDWLCRQVIQAAGRTIAMRQL